MDSRLLIFLLMYVLVDSTPDHMLLKRFLHVGTFEPQVSDSQVFFNLLIESDPLLTSLKESLITKLSTFNGGLETCKSLSEILHPEFNSYYIFTDYSADEGLESIWTCQGKILGFSIVNPTKTSRFSIIKALQEINPSASFEVYTGEICEFGEFDMKLGKCKYATRRLTDEEDFDLYAGITSIPEAVNFYYDSATTQSFYDYMVTALLGYSLPVFVSSSDFLELANAIDGLMSSEFRSTTSMDSLQDLSLSLHSVTQDYLNYPDSIQAFLNIQALYLDFYSQVLDKSSEDFFTKATIVDTSLKALMVNITEYSEVTLEDTLSYISDHYLLTTSISIYYIKTQGSLITACLCEFCVKENVIGRVDITYIGTFNDGDSFSTQLYNAGSIEFDSEGNPMSFPNFTEETPISIADSCLNTTVIIQLYSAIAPYSYSCLNINNANNLCSITINSSTSATLQVTGQELFIPWRNCLTHCEICSNDPDICITCNSQSYLSDFFQCPLCHNTCQTCTSLPQCTTCKENASPPDINGNCTCILTFGLEIPTGNCVSCIDSNCGNCTENFEICDTCNDGFFIEGIGCSQCHFSCKTCENAENCVECEDGLGDSDATGCHCPSFSGFVNQTSQCQPCVDSNCVECLNDYLLCQACPEGFYLDSNTCIMCDPRCNTCENGASCTSCREQAGININGMCACENLLGFDSNKNCSACIDLNCENCSENNEICQVCTQQYFEDLGSCSACRPDCNNCTNADFCETCKEHSTDTSGFCPCDSTFGREPTNNNCISCEDSNCINCSDNFLLCDMCPDRFFLNSSICLPCEFTCETCNNGTSCSTCKGNSIGNLEGFCTCNTGYGRDQALECSLCSENCIDCASDYSVCIQCEDGFFLENQACFPCESTCKTCENIGNCLTCWENAEKDLNNHCLCLQSFGTNLTTGFCENCDEKCDFCTENYLVCTDCSPPYGLNLPTGLCEVCIENCDYCHSNSLLCEDCSPQYFFNSISCQICDFTCQECSDINTCIDCWENAGLSNGTCTCNIGFGLNATGHCEICSENCQSCYSNFLECEECVEPFGLDIVLKTCMSCSDPDCLHCHADKDICTECKVGTFVASGACETCEMTCQSCVASSTNCTTCWDNASLNPDFTCTCQYGFGLNLTTGKCEQCDFICDSCPNNYLECESCSNPFGLNTTTHTCDSCESNCEQCHNDITVCTLCATGFFLLSGKCLPCLNTCSTCENDSNCLTCKESAELNNTSYQCSCVLGFGTENSSGDCLPCDGKCEFCTADYTTCTDCFFPYGLNPNTFTCEICTENCIDCHDNSEVCVQCEDQFYLESDICHSCLSTCTKCTDGVSCTECWEHADLDIGICTCTYGFGLNATGQCQLCTDDCYTCTSNSSQCDNCKDPLGLNHTSFTCQQCSDNCINCHNDSAQCELCSDKFYLDAAICSACLGICSTCTGPSTCTVCGQYSSGPDSEQHCTCNERYGLDSIGSCQDCSDILCVDCVGNLNQCNLCTGFSEIINDFCTCNQYYGIDVNTCAICEDPLCFDCSHDLKVCEECVIHTIGSTLPCTCIDHSSFNSGTKECECDYMYLLSGAECLLAGMYVRQSDFTSAEFDSSFTSILFTFNTVIDTSVASTCSSILVSTTGLGTSPVCSFPTDYTIKVSLGLGWSVSDSDSFEVNSYYIRRTTGEYYLTYTNVVAQLVYTTQPTAPTVIVSGPSNFATTCSTTSLTYKSSKSSGIASDSFIYAWSTNLPSSPTGILPSFDLSSSYISGSTFQVSLTITNKFSLSSAVTFSVTIIEERVLTVSLDSGTEISMKSSESRNIQATIKDYCGLTGIPTYTWTSSPTMSTVLSASKTPSKLSIYSNSLPSTSTPYIFSVSVSLLGVSGTASVSITVTNSALKLVINSPSGEITSSLGFSADASGSYDPDSPTTVISYNWSTSPTSILLNVSPLTSSVLTIPGNNLQGNSAFTLTLTISADTRSSIQTMTYSIKDDVNTVIKMILPSKTSISKQVLIQTSITSTTGSVIKWKELKGTGILIKPDYFPYISFASNTLSGGTTYQFQIEVTEKTGKYLRSYAIFTTNLGAACSGSLVFFPQTAVTKTTITISISRCLDLDSVDRPIGYAFGYNNGKKNTALGGTTTDDNISKILPVGTMTFYVKVTDSLGDGNTYYSSSNFISTQSRRNLKENDLEAEYLKDAEKYGVVNALVFYLNSYEVTEEMIGDMWEDFISYIGDQGTSEDSLDLAVSITNEFLNPLQSSTFTTETIKKYSEFLISQLNFHSEIPIGIASQVVAFVDRLLEITDKFLFVGKEVIGQLFTHFHLAGSDPVTFSTERVSIYKSEEFEQKFTENSIKVGKSSFRINQLGLPSTELLSVESASYESGKCSDVFSLLVIFDESFDGLEVIKQSPVEVDLKNGVEIVLAVYYEKNCECVYLDHSGNSEKCDFVNTTGNFTVVTGYASGIYYMRQVESIEYSKMPIVIVLALLLLGFISVVFLQVFTKKTIVMEQPKLNLTVTTEMASDRSSKQSSLQLDMSFDQSIKKSYVEGLLIFSLCKENPDFSKPFKVLILISTFAMEICMQNLMLSQRNINENVYSGVVGMISVGIVLPFAVAGTVLLSKSGKLLKMIGVSVVITMQLTSIIGILLVNCSDDWAFAMVGGVVTEVFIGQTAAYTIRKVIS